MFQIIDNKIVLPQRAINRIFHGTHSLPEVLRQIRGATLLVGITTDDGRKATVPVFKDEKPWDTVVGIDLEVEGQSRRFFSDFKPTFMVSQSGAVAGIKCAGLPMIIKESWDQKEARKQMQLVRVAERRIERIT